MCRGNDRKAGRARIAVGAASMRPRHMCRGNTENRNGNHLAEKRFNEAAAHVPRKPPPVENDTNAYVELQ